MLTILRVSFAKNEAFLSLYRSLLLPLLLLRHIDGDKRENGFLKVVKTKML